MRHEALPKELMEMQLGQIDLLLAMYASDESVSIDDACSTLAESLKAWCECERQVPPEISQPSISLLLSVAISDDNVDELAGKAPLELKISFPLVVEEGSLKEALVDPPKAKIRIRQPAWMSKAQTVTLADGIPDEDILTALDYVRDAACQHLIMQRQLDATTGALDEAAAICRTWFYFPSISTRSKRDDIVNYAPTYGLTGFLLAGKPGILCLEGGSQAIDDYMKFIKTESWGDIPPQHKKVSERYREAGPELKRAFSDMQEITNLVGERRGERANRNDMKALEAWLTEHGVGEAFAKILI